MKTKALMVVLLMLAATLVSAGTKRVETLRGSVAISIDGADGTGFKSGFRPIQISEMAGGAQIWRDRSWDRMVGSVIMPDLDDVGDSIDNENKVDTLIVNYKFISSWFTYSAESDTVTLPGTTLFVIDADMWADPTEVTVDSTYTATDSLKAYAFGYGYVKPKLTGDYLSLLMDQFVMEYYVSDTAGTSGTLTGELQYWFKFYEDD